MGGYNTSENSKRTGRIKGVCNQRHIAGVTRVFRSTANPIVTGVTPYMYPQVPQSQPHPGMSCSLVTRGTASEHRAPRRGKKRTAPCRPCPPRGRGNMRSRRRPAFAPGGTIIGAGELDFRVRDGNGYRLPAIAAGIIIPCNWSVWRSGGAGEYEKPAATYFRALWHYHRRRGA